MLERVTQALDGFLSSDKAIRDKSSEVLERGDFAEVVDGLLQSIMTMNESASLAAVLLRNRIVKDSGEIQSALETKDGAERLRPLKEGLSVKLLKVYQECTVQDIRLQVINCITAVCGIFYGNDVWEELFYVIESQLSGDEERLVEALSLIEKLSEYESVREVLVTVGLKFLGAVNLALKNPIPRINSQAAKSVASFLEYFDKDEKFSDLCQLLPDLVEVCVLNNPEEENLTSLNSALVHLSETDYAISAYIESPVPVLAALHKVIADVSLEDSHRGVAMQCFGTLLACFNSWLIDEANQNLVEETFINIMSVVAGCIETQWAELKDDPEPFPQEDHSCGQLLMQAVQALDVILMTADDQMNTYLLQAICQHCQTWSDPSMWAKCYAGFQTLDHFIYHSPGFVRRHHGDVWEHGFTFWKETSPLSVHQWTMIVIMESMKTLISEMMSLDPFMDQRAKEMIPFLVANLMNNSGHVRQSTATALGEWAVCISQTTHYPMVVMKEAVQEYAEKIIDQLLACWSLNVHVMNDQSSLDADHHQVVLMQQADIFDAAGQWCALFATEDYQSKQQIILSAMKMVDVIGSLKLSENRVGAAKCMQKALKIATENIASQFQNNYDECVNNGQLKDLIHQLVTIIVQLQELIEKNEPFYCSATWRTYLLEALGNLGSSGEAFNPYIEQALPIFLTPLAKEGGDITTCDPDEIDEGATKLVYKEHGIEQAIKIDTSVWDDQMECLWGLKTLLTSYGAEKLLRIGQDIMLELIPILERSPASSPVMYNLFAALAACFRHFGTQVVSKVVEPTPEVLHNFMEQVKQVLIITRAKVDEAKDEPADPQNGLLDTSDVRGPIELVDGLFRTFYNLQQGDVVLPEAFMDHVISEVFEGIMLPGVKMLLANEANEDINDVLEEDDSLSPLEFLSEIENAIYCALKASGPKVFAKMRSLEIDAVWPRRLAAESSLGSEMYDRTNSLIAIAHMIAYGGPLAGNAYAQSYVNVVSTICKADFSREIEEAGDPHEDTSIRQAATFGVSVLFEKSFSLLSEDDKATMLDAIQVAALDHPYAKHLQRRGVLENAIMAYLFYHMNSHSPPEKVLQYFEMLPVYADTEEVERLAGLFAQLYKNQHPWLTSPLLRPYIVQQLKQAVDYRREVDNPRLLQEITTILNNI